MIKKILKSILVLGFLGVVVVGATRAWFTSNVVAEDNEITAGTLMIAVDSTREHVDDAVWALYSAYNVVRDIDGVSTPGNPLEPWVDAEPGVYTVYTAESGADDWEAGNNSVWIAVRNKGTLDLNYRFLASGAWQNPLPREGSSISCLTGMPYQNGLVRVRNVHRYATTPTGGCENHEECRNLRDALQTGPWSPASTATADVTGDPVSWVDDSVVLGAEEFVIYRLDMNLRENTSNCYQGATYLYDLTVDAKQVGAPSF